MSLEIRISEPASFDLAQIWNYLYEESSESVATKFVERIKARAAQAASFPFSGAPRFHLAPGLRVLFYEQYAIYYVPKDSEVIVARVLHGARDLTAIAEEGGFTL